MDLHKFQDNLFHYLNNTFLVSGPLTEITTIGLYFGIYLISSDIHPVPKIIDLLFNKCIMLPVVIK